MAQERLTDFEEIWQIGEGSFGSDRYLLIVLK